MAGHGQDVAGRGLDAAEVPLVEAARLLNTTPEALRKRLQRGKSIRGTKRDGEWYVRLPAAVASRGQDAGSPPSGRVQDVGRDTAGHGQDASTPREDPFARELVDVLEAEVADLRQANGELRRLLALALQTRALPEPRDIPTDPSGGPTEARSRPWWAALLWWRR